MANQTQSITDVQTVVRNTAGAMSMADPFIANANKDEIDFVMNPAQTGATCLITRPATGFAQDTWDMTGNEGAVQQETQTFTVDKQIMANIAASGVDWATRLVNNKPMLDDFLQANARSIAIKVAQKASEKATEQTYRCYHGGLTAAGVAGGVGAINDMTQIRSAANAMFDYGAQGQYDLYLDSETNNAVVDSGLSKFTLNRNNSEAQSWLIGDTENLSMLRASTLHTHVAGTVGNAGTELTLTNVNAAGNQLTFSGAGAAATVFENDILEFQATTLSEVSYLGHVDMGYRRAQARVIAPAVATAAGVIVLNVELGNNKGFIAPNAAGTEQAFQNINRALISAGANSDKARIIPSHKVGLLAQKRTYFLGMPKLDVMSGWESASESVNGVSLRLTDASDIRTAQMMKRMDCLAGWCFTSETAMRIALPVAIQ